MKKGKNILIAIAILLIIGNVISIFVENNILGGVLAILAMLMLIGMLRMKSKEVE